MEHFRWGKPVSRKRRPVKVRASVTAGDEDTMEAPMETATASLTRRQLQEEQKKNANTKNTAKYRITHFRWNAPSATKRYGGFMKSLSERSHRPLLTLLRNIIAKNTQ
ncbi:Pro-opiomelanocortin-1 [Bagarius yarrelli]|uniref:Pro-opiomelanocortin-1 n=1 Tax=Bagarius yarrelli TaxID=175774 RepID=A0A556V272_BAGYA|nr:Pro-opiomelanocortin-1 [Bagarius yarrelli]